MASRGKKKKAATLDCAPPVILKERISNVLQICGWVEDAVLDQQSASQQINGAADSSTWERFLDRQLDKFAAVNFEVVASTATPPTGAIRELAFVRLAARSGAVPAPLAQELEDALSALDDAVATVDLDGDASIAIRAAFLRILATSILFLAVDAHRRGDVVHDEEDARIGDDGKVREP